MADLKMPEINYVIVAGNLTKDPIFRHTPALAQGRSSRTRGSGRGHRAAGHARARGPVVRQAGPSVRGGI